MQILAAAAKETVFRNRSQYPPLCADTASRRQKTAALTETMVKLMRR